jgi:hypothetical protein
VIVMLTNTAAFIDWAWGKAGNGLVRNGIRLELEGNPLGTMGVAVVNAGYLPSVSPASAAQLMAITVQL